MMMMMMMMMMMIIIIIIIIRNCVGNACHYNTVMQVLTEVDILRSNI
jgi:hypothetical protein